MKIFLKNITIFIFPLLLVNLFFICIVYSSYLKEYEKVDLNFKTYFLADSRGMPLIEKVPSKGFYNFAAPSDSYIDMERKLIYLIDNSKIERLILTVDDHTLSKYREESNNSDRSIHFKQVKSLNDFYEVFKDKYVIRFCPLLSPKARDIVTVYFFKPKKKKKTQDWIYLSDEKKANRCKIRIAYQFPNEERSKVLMQSLKNIVTACKKNNIKLYGIRLPLAKEYIEAQKNNSYGAEKYFVDEHIEILDFKKEYIAYNDLFFNEDHLNKKGGVKLTRLLINKLEDYE
jgi:hypothetical protein